jgi:pectate lyase
MARPKLSVRFDGVTLAVNLGLGCLVLAGACSAEQQPDGDERGSGQGGSAGSGAATGGVAGTTAGNGSGGVVAGNAGTGATTGGASSGGTSGAATGGIGGGSPSGGAGAGTGGLAGAGAGGAGNGGAGAGGKGGAGAGGMPACMTPPAAPPLIGWATQAPGTTGGGNAMPVVVTTAAAFTSAIGGSTAQVIHVAGVLSGSFAIGSNKTIIGVCGAELRGDVHLNGSANVIMRNLKVVGRNCTDSPGDCSGGEDAVSINGGAHHLWFDHLDVSDGSDGNLDITQGSDFVTVSWTKFSYSSMRTDPMVGTSGHRFSNLIGASDTDPSDVGHLNVTWHHNWWAENVNQRMPRSRRGQIHMLNNLFTSTGNSYCTNAGQDARLLVENSLYLNVTGPLQVTQNGNMRSVGNVFMNTSGGTTNPGGTGFTPPYTYTADPTSGLEAAIRAGVGPK